MNTKKPILNSAVNAPLPESVEAGRAFVIQLAPKGEYPQFVDDPDHPGQQNEVVQIIDDQSIKTLVDNFKDKVLVDADHSSETSTNTRAYAWVTKLYVDPEKGLMAEIEPTTVGAAAINGKEYRFVSGAWTLDDDGRPVELVSIGLTNKPNLPVAPMINAQGAKGNDAGDGNPNAGNAAVTQKKSPEANAPATKNDDAQSAANPDGSHKAAEEEAAAKAAAEAEAIEKKRKFDMDIRTKFGLPAEATDEEVEQAIDAVLGKCAAMEQVANALGMEPTASNEDIQEALNAVLENCGALQTQNAEMETARLNAEADQLVAENEDVIPEDAVDGIKEQYASDPEAAKETVANMRKVYERAVRNAKAASAPTAKKPVSINWSSAKKPVAINMESMLADCGGDPAKENEVLRSMNR